MPRQNGQMHARFFGATPHEQLADKIVQMRSDLVHIQRALSVIDGLVRRNAPAEAVKSEFSILHNWYLSALESFFAMVWAAFERGKVDEAIRDFEKKFRDFTSVRAIQPAARPKA